MPAALDVLALAAALRLWQCPDRAIVQGPVSALGLRRDHRLAERETCAAQGDRNRRRCSCCRKAHCLRGPRPLRLSHRQTRAHADAFEATSLPTLVQMVDNGPRASPCCRSWRSMPVSSRVRRWWPRAGRKSTDPSATIALVWRKGTARKGRVFSSWRREIARLGEVMLVGCRSVAQIFLQPGRASFDRLRMRGQWRKRTDLNPGPCRRTHIADPNLLHQEVAGTRGRRQRA